MGRRLGEYALFLREFRRTFHTTGAVLPSGPQLYRALARYVGSPAPHKAATESNGSTAKPRRVLEVGPGTGAVTAYVAARLGEHDTLDLVELNDRFVEHLRERLATEPRFAAVAPRTKIHHARLEDLGGEHCYDTIVSGLPLNNFPIPLVQTIFASFERLIAPDGTLSFFEYIAVRRVKSIIARREERARLRDLTQLLGDYCRRHEFKRQAVLTNVPPAWVHHLRFSQPQ